MLHDNTLQYASLFPSILRFNPLIVIISSRVHSAKIKGNDFYITPLNECLCRMAEQSSCVEWMFIGIRAEYNSGIENQKSMY